MRPLAKFLATVLFLLPVALLVLNHKSGTAEEQNDGIPVLKREQRIDTIEDSVEDLIETDGAVIATPSATQTSDGQAVIAGLKPDHSHVFYETPLGEKLSAYFRGLKAMGFSVETTLKPEIAELKKYADAATTEMVDAYRRLGEEDYDEKIRLLYMMNMIESPRALPLLSDLVGSRLPAASVSPSDESVHAFKPVSESQTVLRMGALSALSALAQSGNVAARSELLSVATLGDNETMRAYAVRYYLNSSDNPAADAAYVRSVLPPEYHYLTRPDTDTPNEIAGLVPPLKQRK